MLCIIYILDFYNCKSGFNRAMSSRAMFYRSFATFQFQPYLDKVNVSKYLQAYRKLRMSLHRLEDESGRWVRQNRVPIHERKCFFL